MFYAIAREIRQFLAIAGFVALSLSLAIIYFQYTDPAVLQAVIERLFDFREFVNEVKSSRSITLNF